MRRFFLSLTLLIIVPTILFAQSLSPEAQVLRDMLSHVNCQRACWQGIEPGVTTQAQVQHILRGLGITYQVKNELGLGAPVSDQPYGWVPDDKLPFIDTDGGQIEVRIYFAQGIVQGISLPVDIPLSMILKEYGAPIQVRQTNETAFELVYPSLGMIFLVGKPDTSHAVTLNLASELGMQQFISPPDAPYLLHDCSIFDSQCSIATATPTPDW